MWTWLMGGYAVFAAVMIAAACFVALFGRDEEHRTSGYRVLKLIFMAVTGSGGLTMAVLKLYELGLSA
ncbi:hypothetical protein EDD40_3188 [Saccharothrix texasensis]|uniref:Uncharacterized protein n=2 Tax=Saccharothrix texasensis TaxID=103734 RepID=A0A3N1H5T6_9PSEU|nr:hypothetical protein EDD40_3188 [Saccharothrix texasensis]